MSLLNFHHTPSFAEPDPLGNGLAEEIAAEQAEADAIVLQENPDGQSLSEQWQHVVEEVEQDPDWFSFAEDDE
jgi:hypothetical protein